LNPDFLDMLSALLEAQAEFLVVGAQALAVHGYPRATGDLDIWVRPSKENAQRVWQAIEKFGAPRRLMKIEDFWTENTVFQIGVPPHRIDLMTSIEAVTFDAAWNHRIQTEVDGVSFFVRGRSELLQNKRAAGRPKDLGDVAWLEANQS
jgi:hypothetical protein